jgi:hypothetical protein
MHEVGEILLSCGHSIKNYGLKNPKLWCMPTKCPYCKDTKYTNGEILKSEVGKDTTVIVSVCVLINQKRKK